MSADRAALLSAYRRLWGRPAQVVAEAPGRVNLIGEHTDYNGGHALPLAIDRSVAVAAAPHAEVIRVHAMDYGEEDSFAPAEVQPLAGVGWRNHVRGVVWALREAGHRLRGLDLAFSGDVPIGAGLSSSAALEVALAGAFAAASEISLRPGEMAALAQRAENGFVGVQCGPMDQLAAVYGREGHALLIDCRSLEVEAVPLDLAGKRVAIALVDSGVRRALGDSPYNQRRRECAQAAAALGVSALRDVTREGLEARRQALPAMLYRRARHVVSEEARVRAAAVALRGGDLEDVGRLLYESHKSLRDDFEVSRPELDLPVGMARRRWRGCWGARLTGAGFGGCTVNLVREEALGEFERGVLGAYREETGLPAEMHLVRPSEGLRVSSA